MDIELIINKSHEFSKHMKTSLDLKPCLPWMVKQLVSAQFSCGLHNLLPGGVVWTGIIYHCHYYFPMAWPSSTVRYDECVHMCASMGSIILARQTAGDVNAEAKPEWWGRGQRCTSHLLPCSLSLPGSACSSPKKVQG